jgi:hypothetical protein
VHPAHRKLRLLLGTLLAIGLVLATAASASALTFGLNWDGNSTSREESLEEVQASGATVYHLPLEYNGPGGDWTNNDALVEEAWERGITILPTVQRARRFPLPLAPGWNAWGEWVRELVERYGLNGSLWDGKANPTPITAWEIWNEPNIAVNNPQLSEAQCEEIGQPWNPEGENCSQPQSYGAFLKYSAEQMQAASLAKTSHGTDVLFGSINTQVGENYETFLAEAALAGGLGPDVTGVAIHPYSFDGGAAGMAEDVGGVRAYLDALPEGAAKSLWITEMGWPTEGTVPDGETVDQEELATLLNESFEWVKLNAPADDIQLAAWYNLRDFGGETWDGWSGLQAEDGTPHPAWFAFQQQTGAEPSGNVWAAFQAETGTLWIYSTAAGYQDTGQPMAPGTSPTVTAPPGGGALVSFTAASGEPATYSTKTGELTYGLAPPPEVDQAVAVGQGIKPLVAAFKAYISAIWANSDPTGAFGTSTRIAPGTVPSVATVP